MNRRLFHMTTSSMGLDVRHSDGRRAAQATAAVWALSKKAAAQALGVSLYEFNNYGNVGWDSAETELADIPNGVVMLRSMDPHGTVEGDHGWVPVAAHQASR